MNEDCSGSFRLIYQENLEDAVEVHLGAHKLMGTVRRWRRDSSFLLLFLLAVTAWDGYRRNTWSPPSLWLLPAFGIVLVVTVRARLRCAIRRQLRQARAGTASRATEIQLTPSFLSCRSTGVEHRLDWSNARCIRVTAAAIEIEYEPPAAARIPMRAFPGQAESARWIVELERLTGLVAVRD